MVSGISVSRKIFRVLILGLAAVLAVVLSMQPASAEPFRKQSRCGPSPTNSHTTRLDAFSGHHVDVSQKICQNGTFVKWASQPSISFPSRFNPMGPIESVSVSQQPFIYSKDVFLGKVQRVTWRFTVKQKIKLTPMAQEFVFYYRAYPAYSQLCMGKSCAKKHW